MQSEHNQNMKIFFISQFFITVFYFLKQHDLEVRIKTRFRECRLSELYLDLESEFYYKFKRALTLGIMRILLTNINGTEKFKTHFLRVRTNKKLT